jgi:hypothetical protein
MSYPYNDDDKLSDQQKSGGPLTSTMDGVPALPSGKAAMSAEDRKRIEKSLKRKLDFGMMPLIILIYILNYLDRQVSDHATSEGLACNIDRLPSLHALFSTVHLPSPSIDLSGRSQLG